MTCGDERDKKGASSTFFWLRRVVSVGEESRLKNGGFLEREDATSL